MSPSARALPPARPTTSCQLCGSRRLRGSLLCARTHSNASRFSSLRVAMVDNLLHSAWHAVPSQGGPTFRGRESRQPSTIWSVSLQLPLDPWSSSVLGRLGGQERQEEGVESGRLHQATARAVGGHPQSAPHPHPRRRLCLQLANSSKGEGAEARSG